MKRLVLIGAAAVALAGGGFAAAGAAGVDVPVVLPRSPAPPAMGVVSAVLDGATLEVRSNDHPVRVRLEGVQTPQAPAVDRPGQCLGAESAAALGTIAPAGSQVRLEYRRDAFDREVVRASTADGRLVNAEVARLGFAGLVGSEDGPFAALLERAAHEAAIERRGLHSPAAACTVPGQVENLLARAVRVPPAAPPVTRAADLVALADTATQVRAAADELSWASTVYPKRASPGRGGGI